jgi:hypothetical protein
MLNALVAIGCGILQCGSACRKQTVNNTMILFIKTNWPGGILMAHEHVTAAVTRPGFKI